MPRAPRKPELKADLKTPHPPHSSAHFQELRARAGMWDAIRDCFKKLEEALDIIIEQERKG